MPQNRFLFGLLGGVLALVIVLRMCTFTVRETENAIVIVLGNPRGVVTEAGLNFKLPWADIVKVDKRNLEFDLDRAMEVSDVKQERLTVDAFARYRIVEPLVYYQRFKTSGAADDESLKRAGQEAIKRIMQNSLRQTLGEVSIEDIVTNLRAELMKRIATRMEDEARKFGVEIIDVKIRRADLPPQNSQAVFQRMITERNQLAQQIRAGGNEEAQKIRAQAEREATEIRAAAEEESQKLRGQADAERNAVFAAAYGKDPEFFAFYRSLTAYEEALKKGESTILLSPDSEFLRYLNDLQGRRK